MNFMNENEIKNIKSQVLEKIETGKINMRPHFYFVLQVVALIVVAFLTLLISSLLISFIIFSLIASGKLFLFGFGVRGFLMFFVLFPWSMLIVEVALIILLEWLIKKFKFGYRSSFSRLILGILLISILFSIIIASTPFHNALQDRSERRNLPFVGDYYRGIRHPASGQEIFRGIVSDVGSSSFILNQQIDEDDAMLSQKYIINLPPNLPESAIPAFGDTVFVAGQLMPDNTVQAYGFQIFSSPDTQ